MEITEKLLPLGRVYLYGEEEVEITEDILKAIVKNFKNGYPHYKPFLNVDHRSSEKYGEVVDMEIREDGLWATLELNEDGTALLEDKKFEYLSAEIDMNFVDRKTGEKKGPVLLGVALTNRPAMPIGPIKRFAEVLGRFFVRLFQDRKKYKDFILETGREWNWDWSKDANKILEENGWKGLAKVCLYVDIKNFEKGESGFPENKEAYYFPFAKLHDDGKYHAYFRAFAAIMAILNGARGGTKLSTEVKQAVYKKVVEWYKAFGKKDEEIPELKLSESEVKSVNELEQLKQENEELRKKIETLQAQVKEYAEREKEKRLQTFKEELVREGVPPAVVEKGVKLLSEEKLSEDELKELLMGVAKKELTKQYSENVSEKKTDVVKEIAKLKGWL